MPIAIFVIALMLFIPEAEARNQPCSGSKGGISHCSGSIFVCRNGTTSQSKRSCSMASPAAGASSAGVGVSSGRSARSAGKAKRRR